jgi:hypothetical protein
MKGIISTGEKDKRVNAAAGAPHECAHSHQLKDFVGSLFALIPCPFSLMEKGETQLLGFEISRPQGEGFRVRA